MVAQPTLRDPFAWSFSENCLDVQQFPCEGVLRWQHLFSIFWSFLAYKSFVSSESSALSLEHSYLPIQTNLICPQCSFKGAPNNYWLLNE